MDRRAFLELAGAGSLASLAAPSLLTASRIRPIGVQLYTVRRDLERDFDGTIAQLARIGYRELEFVGYFGRTPQQVRALLRQHRLSAPSRHLDFDVVSGPGFARAIDDAKVVGHRYLTAAWVPQEQRRTIDGWRRIADTFNRAGEQARRAGLQLAYHNHSYEFVPLEGQVPYDVLLEATDPRLVQLEIDLYWITLGGKDPLDYFARWPGRVPMVHVKDLSADRRMVDVGAGTIDWRRIFAQRRQAGIRHFFVEHDEPADAIASVTNSYRYLSALEI